MTCRDCGSSDGPFYERHSPGLCKPCANARAKRYQTEHPGYMDEWRKRNPDGQRRARLAREYGLTLEDYDDLVANQGGACAICGEVPSKPLYVDHDHETGEVRGLLCPPCNGGLGQFRDNPTLLRCAVSYLAAPPAQGHLTLRVAA